MKDKQTEKRYRILSALIHFIEDYYNTYKTPVSMRILSVKFARPLKLIGDDFRGTIRSLRLDGSIQAVLRRSGRTDFFPEGIDLDMEGVLPSDAVKRSASS